MEDTKDLRVYLLSRFLLTLTAVGIAQTILNAVIRSSIMPRLETMLGLDGILTGKSVAEAILIFAFSIIMVWLRTKFGTVAVAEGILSSRFVSGLFGDSAMDVVNAGVGGGSLGMYIARMSFMALLLSLIWVLPFLVGATWYAYRVSGRVNDLEKRRAQREKDYEKQRNLLLSDITHDIKTPITTIAGFAQALSDGTVPEGQQQEYLDAIYGKSMKVSELVSLLFEYIKLDSTGYTLNRTAVDLAELVRECVAGSYTEMEEKHFETELDIPEGQILADADKMQLERAINNILSNTIKHNDEGTRVVISLTTQMQEAVLSISDSGSKIDREDAVHIFEPFVRGDKSRRSGAGNGLGLSITKKIVEMHGGKIVLIQYGDFEKYKLTKTFKITIPIGIS